MEGPLQGQGGAGEAGGQGGLTYLRQVPSNYLETAGSDGSTSPLHDAAKRGNIEMVQECLLNKMPVNQGDPAGAWAQGPVTCPCRQHRAALGGQGGPGLPPLPPHPRSCATGRHQGGLCLDNGSL